MTIAETLSKMRVSRGRRLLAELIDISLSKPDITDYRLLPEVYDRFRQVADPGFKDNNRLFTLIAFFLCDPASLVRKRIGRGRLRREIAATIGTSPSVVTRYFADAKSLFLHHKLFRAEAERVYEALTQGYSARRETQPKGGL